MSLPGRDCPSQEGHLIFGPKTKLSTARPRLHLASPAEFMATLLACVEIDEIHEHKYGSSRKENMTFTAACKLF